MCNFAKAHYSSYCNPIDPETLATLQRGVWQDFIPVTGTADPRGEIARDAIPQEDFDFDSIIKEDLQKVWKV